MSALLTRLRALYVIARPGALSAAAWAWKHRTVVLLVLAILFAAAGLRACRRADTAEASLAAARERAAVETKAEAAGFEPVREVPQAQVDEEGARAAAENPVLRARIEQLEATLGKTRLALAARIRTAAAPVADAPRPAQPAGEPVRPAVLLAGDPLRLDADLQVREKDGAHILVGTLAAWRAADEVLLWRQPYSGPLSEALRTAPPTPTCLDHPGRIGIGGGATDRGWIAGGVATYRIDVWGWRPELVAALKAGPGGIVATGDVALFSF